MDKMNKDFLNEYSRLYFNYNICLLGLISICEYCKDKAKPSPDLKEIGDIIGRTLNSLVEVPSEVKNEE